MGISALVFLASVATFNPAYKPWKFAVVGDTQNRYGVVKKILLSMKRRKIKFALHLGDVHWCGSRKHWLIKNFLFSRAVPKWLITFGNHARWPCSLPVKRWLSWRWSRKRFGQIFYKGKGDTLRYLDYKDRRFISLDTASRNIPKGHSTRYLKILRSSKKPVFVISHRPIPYPSNFSIRMIGRKHTFYYGSGVDPVAYRYPNRKIWKYTSKYRRKIGALFHGHYHAYVRYKLGLMSNSIPAYSSGGGGGNLETHRDFYHWLEVTVYGLGPRDFRVKVIKI